MAIKFTPKVETEPTVPAKKKQDVLAESLRPAATAENAQAGKPAAPKAKKAAKPAAEDDRKLL